jgi:tetratricopeptide (TPR) repeat protein
MKSIGLVAVILGASAGSLAAPQVAPMNPPPLKVPDPETRANDAALKLPTVPSFDLPPQAGPDLYDPRYLRVKGKPLLDTNIKVRGYIIWIYDCIVQVRQPKESRAQTQRRIDDDPTLCERPKLYLGESKKTPVERGLWVVDVPRPPNKLEKLRLPKEELAAWPKVPVLRVGDYVEIAGDFKIASPHSERNSDGLVVFASSTTMKAPAAAKPAKGSGPSQTPTETALKVSAVPPVAPISRTKHALSVSALAKGNAAHANRQYPDAIAAYREAIAAWDQNHLAWFGLGGALAGQGNWAEAEKAFTRCFAARPDSAMYAMWSGVASYEAAITAAKAQEATRTGRSAADITLDQSKVNFDIALERLRLATQLEPALWRAQYYLGRVYRAKDQQRSAAEHFTQAIVQKRDEQGPYVALAELYRKWDYTKEAIEVATLGTAHLTGDSLSDIYYVLGMAHDDQLKFAPAIEAYSKALDAKATNHKARFQRGQAYFKLGKLAKAKADLVEFMASAGSSLEFAKQQANKMLFDIDAKTPSAK